MRAPLLLATEHTEQDAGAEALALALARRRAVSLAAVLPVALDAELEMTAPDAAERADIEAARRCAALQDGARAAGVVLELKLRQGPQPHAEILEEARSRGAGLLIIRRRGRRSLLANLLVGEMVGRVLEQAPCSVLVVPRDARLWQREVLVGVDAQHSDPSLPAAAAALARECGAALRLVCVAARESQRAAADEALARALAHARGASHAGAPADREQAARTEVRIGAAPQEILVAARASGADLLVVGRHGGAGAASSPRHLGGTAREITGLAPCAVLLHASPRDTSTPQGHAR